MRTHINNKLYDTATAKKIFHTSNNLSTSDLRYQEVGVYKKQTSEYFLYQCIGTQGIITPITYEQAKDYTLNYGTKLEYDKEFGVVSDSETTFMRFELPLDVKRKIDMLASMSGKTKTQVVIDIIRSV